VLYVTRKIWQPCCLEDSLAVPSIVYCAKVFASFKRRKLDKFDCNVDGWDFFLLLASSQGDQMGRFGAIWGDFVRFWAILGDCLLRAFVENCRSSPHF
jgi:hypothetical protein